MCKPAENVMLPVKLLRYLFFHFHIFLFCSVLYNYIIIIVLNESRDELLPTLPIINSYCRDKPSACVYTNVIIIIAVL